MRVLVLFISTIFILSACGESVKETPKKEKKKFEMYRYSQMAALMRQMYSINEELKTRIEKGEDLGTFPNEFEQILHAEMTKKQKHDDFFKKHANLFLESQRNIYANPKDAKALYNISINSCVECHQTKCPGPIAKIKHLELK